MTPDRISIIDNCPFTRRQCGYIKFLEEQAIKISTGEYSGEFNTANRTSQNFSAITVYPNDGIVIDCGWQPKLSADGELITPGSPCHRVQAHETQLNAQYIIRLYGPKTREEMENALPVIYQNSTNGRLNRIP